MDVQLKKSIDHLYSVFARYQGLSRLEGSPLYGELDAWNAVLRSKKLRDLTSEDLSRFAGSVILTWGDADDYRCYLPRILELTADLDTPYDVWIIYSRLEDAGWKRWDRHEQDAINTFTLAMWEDLLQNDSEKAEWEFADYFHAIAFYYHDFPAVLKAWQECEHQSAVHQLVHYVLKERENIFDKDFIDSRTRNTARAGEFRAWLTSDKLLQKLSQAFFSEKDAVLAEKISWVEKILSDEKKQMSDLSE